MTQPLAPPAKFDPLVRCKCGWVGRTSMLVNADGCYHCPDCGEFFMPIASGEAG